MPHRPVGRARLRACTTVATLAALTFSGTAGYTVRPGETLSGIAARNGLSVSRLAAANGIANPHLILAGQQLNLPGSASGVSNAPGSGIHPVLPGQTLISISIRYGVKMSEIAAANGLSSYDRIYAGQRLRIPGRSTAATPATVGSRDEIGAILDRRAREYGFAPRFVKAVAYLESGWNNRVVSSVGAVGVMQVLPSTGEFVSDYLVGRPLDLDDPDDNVVAGVAFLAYLWRLTDGDVERTLAGYYQGLRSVSDNGMYPSTERYVANVLAIRDRMF